MGNLEKRRSRKVLAMDYDIHCQGLEKRGQSENARKAFRHKAYEIPNVAKHLAKKYKIGERNMSEQHKTKEEYVSEYAHNHCHDNKEEAKKHEIVKEVCKELKED